ncbi:hypothetical protein K491DRAFT_681122 [Lophiostoma macrostomum CBS 122681]|uniref:Extracellular membrane protein CFEM domain-containing protein n=1 Tax=Lophiostoma macrostomum CBS 122681 TaxID=1314788 RepID=A0A6A6T1H8_9PLEO|nr:hypothetical protein K491DRAFT_681122 [Lophiostoma macrostomum CBS 122681]
MDLTRRTDNPHIVDWDKLPPCAPQGCSILADAESDCIRKGHDAPDWDFCFCHDPVLAILFVNGLQCTNNYCSETDGASIHSWYLEFCGSFYKISSFSTPTMTAFQWPSTKSTVPTSSNTASSTIEGAFTSSMVPSSMATGSLSTVAGSSSSGSPSMMTASAQIHSTTWSYKSATCLLYSYKYIDFSTISDATTFNTHAPTELSSSHVVQKTISPGATAGIAVGSALATILIMILAFWIYSRHKKRKNLESRGSGGNTGETPAPIQTAYGIIYEKPELDGRQVEIPHTTVVADIAELDCPGDERRYENIAPAEMG